jgi:hypothetical protein
MVAVTEDIAAADTDMAGIAAADTVTADIAADGTAVWRRNQWGSAIVAASSGFIESPGSSVLRSIRVSQSYSSVTIMTELLPESTVRLTVFSRCGGGPTELWVRRFLRIDFTGFQLNEPTTIDNHLPQR